MVHVKIALNSQDLHLIKRIASLTNAMNYRNYLKMELALIVKDMRGKEVKFKDVENFFSGCDKRDGHS